MKKQKDYIAKLVIEEMPTTSGTTKRLVEWLKEKAKEINKCDPDDYAKPYTARLMSGFKPAIYDCCSTPFCKHKRCGECGCIDGVEESCKNSGDCGCH